MRNCSIIALASIAGMVPAGAQTSGAFRFVHITDTAVSSKDSVESLRKLAAHLNASQPKPDFVVATGNITSMGTDDEFARFQKAMDGLTLYCVPGNQDVQGSPSGKEAFQRVFKPSGPKGKLYQSFDSNGCHFVLLDSTMLLDHRGHFEQAELKWLESDLRRMKRVTPVFVFSHHGIGFEGSEVDNQDELLRALAPYNVVAMFAGYNGRAMDWTVNGIRCFTLPGTASDGTYHSVEVGSSEIRVLRRGSGDGGKNGTLVATFPLNSGPRRRVAFGWDDINIPLLQRRQFLAELRADDKAVRDAMLRAEFAVDNELFRPMAPDERIKPGDRPAREGRFMARFETKGLANGAHALHIRIKTPDGLAFQRQETFQVEQVSGQPKREWTFATGEGIQSTPVLADGTLYVTSTDGKVYALDAKSGKKRWVTATGGPIVASPVVAEGVVYVGSTDHSVYALDAKSGSERWKYDAGTPIFASVAVSQGIVCVGGDRKIIGIDAQTGKERWTQPARSFFQSVAATDGSAFYLRDRDGNRYALDAASGAVRYNATANHDSAPVLDRGQIVSGTAQGVFTWTDAASGRINTQYAIDPGHCFSSAVIGPKMAYMTSMTGQVFAISTP